MDNFLDKTGLAYFWGKIKEAINAISHVIEQNKLKQQKFWRGTKQEYDAIPVKDPNTMYVVTDEPAGSAPIGSAGGDMMASIYDPDNKSQNIFAYADTVSKPHMISISLESAGWDSTAKTQSVSVSGVSGEETAQVIFTKATNDSREAYLGAGIVCSSQSENVLTFTAEELPTVDIVVNVVVWEVRA